MSSSRSAHLSRNPGDDERSAEPAPRDGTMGSDRLIARRGFQQHRVKTREPAVRIAAIAGSAAY